MGLRSTTFLQGMLSPSQPPRVEKEGMRDRDELEEERQRKEGRNV